MALLDEARTHGDDALMIALTHVTSTASDVVHAAATVARRHA